MRVRPVLGVLVPVASFLLLGATRVCADLDVALGNGDRVTGSIVPASEVETFRVDVPRGARVTVTLKGVNPRGGAAPATGFRIVGPDAETLADVPVAAQGRRASVTTHVTGSQAVIVRGDGVRAGDYRLQVKWRSAQRFPIAGDLTAGQAPFVLDLDAGARLVVSVAAARGSPALPRLDRMEIPSVPTYFFPAPSNPASKSHKGTSPVMPSAKGVTLSITDAQGRTGEPLRFTGAALVRLPKSKARKLDLSTRGLGGAGGSGSAFGAIVGPAGGTVTVDPGAGIDGASVQIPEGSLPYPTPIVIGTGVEIVPPVAGSVGAGPTISFGPEGQQFPAGAIVTIPVDPAALGSDTSTLQVFVRDAQGRVTLVPPPYFVDAAAGTVSFPVSHFSDYRAIVRAGAPQDLNGDGIDDLVVTAPLQDVGRGAVYVYFGKRKLALGDRGLGQADATIRGDFELQGLGTRFAVGDVTGDGVADLAATVIGVAAEDSDSEVRVWTGGKRFGQDVARGRFFVLTRLGGQDSRLGTALAIGDVSGDGIADVVASDEFGGPNFGGSVSIFPGGPAFGDASIIDAGVARVFGPVAGDRFGLTLTVADVTGDVVGDVLVGEPQDASQGPGRVLVFRGGGGLLKSPGQAVPLVFTGLAAGEGFGLATAAGDVDGDGAPDLVVGAPRRDVQGAAGAFYVFRGPRSFGGSAANADRVALAALTIEALGSSLLVGPIVAATPGPFPNGVIAGAPGADFGPGAKSGAAFYYDDQTLLTGTPKREPLIAEAAGDAFGALFPLLDWNGDGHPDLVVGAPFSDARATDGGRVSIYFGPTFHATPDVTITSSSADANLGRK